MAKVPANAGTIASIMGMDKKSLTVQANTVIPQSPPLLIDLRRASVKAVGKSPKPKKRKRFRV